MPRRLALMMLLLSALPGCYNVVMKRNVQGLSPLERRQQFFLFGTIGEAHVDLRKECPSGVAQVKETFSPGDVLFTIASVGIYTPRTVFIECQAGRG